MAFRSERHLRLHGQPVPGFAPLSRFWPTADGWVRTHANYPWHRAALLAALELDSAEPAAVAAAVADLPAAAIEERVYAAGGLAVKVRTPADWRELAGPGDPLVQTWGLGAMPPRPAGPRLRVLDLTRVIAGPVATRFLGALGHDVLRLDPPQRPELELHRLDGLLGKRSALLDVRHPTGRSKLDELLDGADVVVHGYRPGALDAFGLSPDDLAERHPGLVAVALSAWGRTPGWSRRRGFDSLVQAATGISQLTSPDGLRPGALPGQLLDHGTGYLVTAAVLEAVERQRHRGGTQFAELSLTATAAELLREPLPDDVHPDPVPWLVRLGDVTVVQPPGSLNGRPLRWLGPPAGYGTDPLSWLSEKKAR